MSENDAEYEDIFALSASYSRPIADRWRIGFGAMYVDDMIDDDKRTLTLRLDSRWSLGFGFQWRWKDDRWISATLNYLEVGDDPVNSPPIPGIGSVTGRTLTGARFTCGSVSAWGPVMVSQLPGGCFAQLVVTKSNMPICAEQLSSLHG